MDILFQVHYDSRVNYIDEIFQHIYFKSASTIIFYICFGVAVILNMYDIIVYKADDLVTVLLIPFYIFLFVFIFFRYERAVKIYEREQKELYGDEIAEIYVTATEENVYMADSTGRAVKISYSDVERVYETPNTIVLFSESELLYIFPKFAFTIGNVPAFLVFLRNKGVKGAK